MSINSQFDPIKIEFETSSEIAFLFAITAGQGLNSEHEIIKMLSEDAVKEIQQLSQSIMDQVGQKTNFKFKFKDN